MRAALACQSSLAPSQTKSVSFCFSLPSSLGRLLSGYQRAIPKVNPARAARETREKKLSGAARNSCTVPPVTCSTVDGPCTASTTRREAVRLRAVAVPGSACKVWLGSCHRRVQSATSISRNSAAAGATGPAGHQAGNTTSGSGCKGPRNTSANTAPWGASGSAFTMGATGGCGGKVRACGVRAGSSCNSRRQARSASAVMVSKGFTPNEVGMTEPSTTTRPVCTLPSGRKTWPWWLTTPCAGEAAIRQPPKGCTVIQLVSALGPLSTLAILSGSTPLPGLGKNSAPTPSTLAARLRCSTGAGSTAPLPQDQAIRDCRLANWACPAELSCPMPSMTRLRAVRRGSATSGSCPPVWRKPKRASWGSTPSVARASPTMGASMPGMPPSSVTVLWVWSNWS